MKTLFVILTAFLAVSLYAGELPVVELFDPTHPSKDVTGTITLANGQKSQGRLRTFGSDQCAIAREFGRRMIGHSYKNIESQVYAKGMELYGNEFFAKCFTQIVLETYNGK